MERTVCTIRNEAADSRRWNERARNTLDALNLNDPDLVDDTGLELVASTRVQPGSSSINFLNCIICDT